MKSYALNKSLVKRQQTADTVPFVRAYLTHFGYMHPCGCQEKLLCRHMTKALKHFQIFTQLEAKGTLTLETLKLMKQPRCPVPDFDPAEIGGPGVVDSDPFVFTSDTWDGSILTWFFLRGTSDMTGEAAIIQEAFDVWAEQIPLTFTRTFNRDEADMVVSWEVGDHGDGSPFDGTGSGSFNIFAHAFFPEDGRIHFDDADNWGTSHGGGTVDLLSVAIHEIGHALGLRHSGSDDAVMFFAINEERRQLHEFDIRGIKSRYPTVIRNFASDFVTRPIWALKSTGGTGTVTIDLGREVRLLAWGQATMADSLNDLDRDNAYAVEVYEVDGERRSPYIWGGAHWGSDGAPSNIYSGAWTGRAQRVTFRISALHTSDLDVFGTANIIILD